MMKIIIITVMNILNYLTLIGYCHYNIGTNDANKNFDNNLFINDYYFL